MKQKLTDAEVVARAKALRDKRNLQARLMRQAYKDCGMVRVKGNLGGVYYE